jgi:FkbM family methyltransferase
MKIIQIGANRGNDDLTNLLNSTQPSKFVIVEPMNIHNESINSCYNWIENKIIENLAIVKDNKVNIDFYYHVDDGPGYEVSSIDLNHILKHGYHESGIIKITVPCININKLLKKHKIINLDILFIDAEGYDDEIIRSIDFNIYKIDKIYFENLHLKTDINDYLKSKGYTVKTNIGTNGWMNLAEFLI